MRSGQRPCSRLCVHHVNCCKCTTNGKMTALTDRTIINAGEPGANPPSRNPGSRGPPRGLPSLWPAGHPGALPADPARSTPVNTCKQRSSNQLRTPKAELAGTSTQASLFDSRQFCLSIFVAHTFARPARSARLQTTGMMRASPLVLLALLAVSAVSGECRLQAHTQTKRPARSPVAPGRSCSAAN